jgi:hypothetical protein
MCNYLIFARGYPQGRSHLATFMKRRSREFLSLINTLSVNNPEILGPTEDREFL